MENLISKRPLVLCCRLLPWATVLGVALSMTVQVPALGGETAQITGFTPADGVAKGDGTSVFALTLKPSVAVVQAPRDVVILVSTAASQSGDYRTKSLATLRSALAKLDPNDRVKLLAFDLNAVPLTPGFVAPNSAEMATAFGALQQRTPLGSCDLEKALDAAAKSFPSDSKLARAIVYIGDGSSRANMLTSEQLDRVVNDLVAQRVPVIAFGVGPRIQRQLLGILAARTGGVVVPEQASVDADVMAPGWPGPCTARSFGRRMAEP